MNSPIPGSKGSYISNKFSSDVNNEIKRLKSQVDLFWNQEKSLYDQLGVSKMSNVLDCGSGPGHLVKLLAQSYQNVKFTSLEMDQTYCDYQKESFRADNVENIAVYQGTINNNPLESELFDLVIVRLVLEHVPDVDTSFTDLKKLLKPGGRLVTIDNDFSLHLKTTPAIKPLDSLYKAYCNARVSEGGDPYIGRKLPTYFSNHGFEDLSFQTLTVHSQFTGDAAFLKSESSAIGMVLVKNGFLDPQEFEQLAKEWRNILSIEDHSFMRMLFMCSGIYTGVEYSGNNKFTELNKANENSASVKSEEVTLTLDGINDFLLSEIERLTKNRIKDLENYSSQTLIHLGLDSINAIDLEESLKSTFNISVSTVDLLDEMTIKKLTERIIELSSVEYTSPIDVNHEEGEL